MIRDKETQAVMVSSALLVAFAMLMAFFIGVSNGAKHTADEAVRKINAYTLVGSDVREKVMCQFAEPIKHVTLVMHWYDTNAELYADYIALADPVESTDVWGWSDCIWQPEDDFAACDVYVMKPDFVHADMNIDTIGHEVMHAACGDYHN